jgi:hypothetical protein
MICQLFTWPLAEFGVQYIHEISSTIVLPTYTQALRPKMRNRLTPPSGTSVSFT